MKRKQTILGILLFMITLNAWAQQKNAAEILQDMKKLNVLGSVMYVAAHPDDENTRMITWLSNDRLYRTAYMSLTRGDGGQNLIGIEKGPKGVGIIRTQELLEARKIDGGEQYFTRAVDFGYSKSADETLRFWDKEKILSDVVWNIRHFQPDVMITRFPPTKRAGHGHHTASAMLAEEAFHLAADPKAYPEQLKHVSVWQTKRLFHNSSTWWDKDLPEKAKNTPQKYIGYNIGTYNPLLGESHNEIASRSRSSHRSQGFGARLARGDQFDYLTFKMGEAYQKDLMDGVDTSWERVNVHGITKRMEQVARNYQMQNPVASVPELLSIYQVLEKAKSSVWIDHKKEQMAELIQQCLGLHMVAKSSEAIITQGEMLRVNLEMILRNDFPVKWEALTVNGKKQKRGEELPENRIHRTALQLNTQGLSSQPYWLEKEYDYVYEVNDQQKIGRAENKDPFKIVVELNLKGTTIPFEVPVIYQWVNPAQGELQTPVVLSKGASLNLDKKVYLFNKKKEEVKVTLTAYQEKLKGELSLNLPNDWKVEPKQYMIASITKGEAKTYRFQVTPPKGETTATVEAQLQNGKLIQDHLLTIDYSHITQQNLFEKAQAQFVHIPLKNHVKKVGYIVGAGDEVPSSLQAIGIEVQEINPAQLGALDLSQFPAIVVGVRAYNTQEALGSQNNALLEYVKKGGNVVVQYNTSHRLKTKDIGPYPLTLSRGRVTEEDSKVSFLAPKHLLMNEPNKITQRDFDDWVQERGLYFVSEWDDAYTPLLSWHDKGEGELQGALLACEYGKGTFIYTGVSFFRQLPAGVSGAYKLFVNLLNYKQQLPK